VNQEPQANKVGQDPSNPPKPESNNRVYKFTDENTVKGIFNKLTVIMISCVVLPVLIQNIYNLSFTHPGRQLFWEDCESIALTSYLLVIMVWDAYKKTKKIELAQIKRTDDSNRAEIQKIT
jgi:hypothetical protein